MKRVLQVLLLLAIVAAIAKLVMMKQEWSGLSEAQVRDKLDAGLARKVEDAEKRKEIADKVVTAMRDKGVIREDAEAPMADAVDSAEHAGDAVETADGTVPEVKEAG